LDDLIDIFKVYEECFNVMLKKIKTNLLLSTPKTFTPSNALKVVGDSLDIAKSNNEEMASPF